MYILLEGRKAVNFRSLMFYVLHPIKWIDNLLGLVQLLFPLYNETVPPRMCSWNLADGLQACDLLSLLQGFLQKYHILFTLFCYCSVAKSCLTYCNPMVYGSLGCPVLHYNQEFAQTYIHRVSDAIQPSCPLSPPSPPALNLSQHQGLFQ